MKRLLSSIVAVVALVGSLTSCDPPLPPGPSRHVQMIELNGLVFQLSYDSWKWYKANDSANGKAWYPYMKWSTTVPACSAPLVGDGPYDFATACERHDFSWGNLKRIDGDFPSSPDVWKGRNKNAADLQFLDDLNARCGEHGWWYRQSCFSTADLYFAAVNLLPPYAAPADAFDQGFVW